VAVTRYAAALVSMLLSGCIVQGGASLGRNLYTQGAADRLTYGGELQTRVALGFRRGPLPLHVGLEAGGHAEESTRHGGPGGVPPGSVATWGFQLGTAFWARHRVSLAPYLDLGSPMGWSSAITGYYVGLTLELPIRLGASSSPGQVNRNYRFIDEVGAIVPFVRLRRYAIDVSGAEQPAGYEIAIGLAVRIELVTDLVDPSRL
jgi:hypothetical protein